MRSPLALCVPLLAGLGAALALSGCASAPPPAPATVPSAPRPPGADVGFPVYPMRLVATGESRGPLAWVQLELDADGALRWHGTRAARLVGARIEDAAGREVLAAAPDGIIALADSAHEAQLREDGVLMIDGRERVYFDEQSRVVSTRFGHPPRYLALRLEGLRPDAVRTGALMVLYAMLRARAL